jgi:hypothetical protein
MSATKTKARNTGPEKNTNSKFTRGLLGSLGLLLLVLIFGASSETNAQTGQNRNDPPIDISLPESDPPDNDPPQNDPPQNDPPEQKGIVCEGRTFSDDTGQIDGLGGECKIKID